jgi:hypothetical protein
VLPVSVDSCREEGHQPDYVGLGTYRCGLDVSGSTPAKSMDGKWLGKLKVDGKKVGNVTFRTTRR